MGFVKTCVVGRNSVKGQKMKRLLISVLLMICAVSPSKAQTYVECLEYRDAFLSIRGDLPKIYDGLDNIDCSETTLLVALGARLSHCADLANLIGNEMIMVSLIEEPHSKTRDRSYRVFSSSVGDALKEIRVMGNWINSNKKIISNSAIMLMFDKATDKVDEFESLLIGASFYSQAPQVERDWIGMDLEDLFKEPEKE